MRKLTLLAVTALFSFKVQAVDFGKQGNTFPVKEKGFIAMIQRKLAGVDIKVHQEQMHINTKRSRRGAKTPCGINKSTKTISHSFDPSYILQEDIVKSSRPHELGR